MTFPASDLKIKRGDLQIQAHERSMHIFSRPGRSSLNGVPGMAGASCQSSKQQVWHVGALSW